MICSRGSRKRCPKVLTWRADPLLVPEHGDICSTASSHDSWHTAFCWCSSHERQAEILVEHSRLLASIWRWNKGQWEGHISIRTGQKNGGIEGKRLSSLAWHPGTVQSGDAMSQMGEIRRDLLLEHGERGWTRRAKGDSWRNSGADGRGREKQLK